MAAHMIDSFLHGRDHIDTHASDNRWRHQESESFLRHASPGRLVGRSDSSDLATVASELRVKAVLPEDKQSLCATYDDASGVPTTAPGGKPLEVQCGPLLNYRRMEYQTWFGSVLIVTKGGGNRDDPVVPELRLRIKAFTHVQEATGYNSDGRRSQSTRGTNTNGCKNKQPTIATQEIAANRVPIDRVDIDESSVKDFRISGTKLYSDPEHTFWRFSIQIPMEQSEIQCEYTIPGLSFPDGRKSGKQRFFVPALFESMRIMFYSCNGFSVGTDEKAWSGAALWNDVLRVHQKTPFHVMIGGGDQIYNDGIRVEGPLRSWADIGSPLKRESFPFTERLRKECDDYYVDNYIRWYGSEPFASSNGQIPQLNLWDDHDIIDGFGSYVDNFMNCPVFRGIGGVANKYYLLFQHHLAPPRFSFTSDAHQTTGSEAGGTIARQLEDTYVLKESSIDSSYIIGTKPGPYVSEHSHSIYARLGARIAFFGIDARTERTRKQVNYPETYDIIFKRLNEELGSAKKSPLPINHLIVLLGIPIAYPRLTWLENIFSSPLIAPIKFLNKRFGFGGSFFNHFDGNVDLLDDLDDHYTARNHKKERLLLVQQLQALAAEFSVRISILGGDVHLAAVGRFYSNPMLGLSISQDYRYMANIISSAIVNKPPPPAVANLLARRNKIHHLDRDTDETLIKFFDKDPGNTSRTAKSNHVTMPSRNWAMITENASGNLLSENSDERAGHDSLPESLESIYVKNKIPWLHDGEVNAGTMHKAANPDRHGRGNDGGLDVCIRVEIDQRDKDGKTQLYGMTIPTLLYNGANKRSS